MHRVVVRLFNKDRNITHIPEKHTNKASTEFYLNFYRILISLALLLQLQQLISKNYFLHISAKEAFKSYIRAYEAHHLKDIFNVETIDLAKAAASFGFTVPPAVDIGFSSAKQNRPRKRKAPGTVYKYVQQKNKKK